MNAPPQRLPSRPTLWGTSRARALRVGVVLAALIFLAIAAETGAVGLLAGFALAALPVPLYVSLALWVDRYEAEPPRLLAKAFAWGALGAAFFSLILNAAVAQVASADWVAAVLGAPIAEEFSKGIALLLLYEWEHDEFDNLTDGVIYAAMIGLGFAMTENVLYYGMAFREGSVSLTFALRGAVFPFAHPLFSAMLGIGLGLARERGDHPRLRRLAPLAGLGAAILLHAAWNLAAGLEGGFWWVYLGLMVPVFLAVLLVVHASLRRESRVLREHLAPLVASGMLPAPTLERLCGLRPRLRAEWRDFREGGLERLRACLRFHHAAGDLAFHRWRVTHGRARQKEVDLFREGDYLRAMREYLD